MALPGRGSSLRAVQLVSSPRTAPSVTNFPVTPASSDNALGTTSSVGVTVAPTGITSTGLAVASTVQVAAAIGVTSSDNALGSSSSIAIAAAPVGIASTGLSVASSVSVAAARPVSDTGLTVTSSVTITAARGVTSSDNALGTTSSVTAGARRGVSSTGLTISDTTSAGTIRGVTSSDNALGSTSSVSTVMGRGVTSNDNALGSTSSLSRAVNRSVTDSGLAITDAVRINPTRGPTDQGVTVTSTVKIAAGRTGVIDTGLTVSSSVGTTVAPGVSSTGLSMTDSVARLLVAPRSVTDTGLAVSDAAGLLRAAGVTDSGIQPSDTVATRTLTQRAITDSGLAMTGEVIRVADSRAVTAQGLSITDSVTRTASHPRGVADTGLAMSSTVGATAGRPIIDQGITIGDSVTRAATRPRAVADTGLAITSSVGIAMGRVVADQGLTATYYHQNTFDGGVEGAALSTGTKTSGDVFDRFPGSSGVGVFAAAAAMQGVMGARFTLTSGVVSAGAVGYDVPARTDDTWARYYFKFDVTPNPTGRLGEWRDSAQAAAAVIRLSNAGKVQIANTVTAIVTGTATLSPGTTYRLETRYRPSVTNAEFEVRIYLGDSTTPLDTLLATGQALSADTGGFRFGQTANITLTSATVNLDVDSPAVSLNGWLGPYSSGVPADTVSATTGRAVASTGLTMSDTVGRAAVSSRAVSDQGLTITDIPATVRAQSRAVADTGLAVSDGVTVARSSTRPVTDTGITAGDSIAASVPGSARITDSVASIVSSDEMTDTSQGAGSMGVDDQGNAWEDATKATSVVKAGGTAQITMPTTVTGVTTQRELVEVGMVDGEALIDWMIPAAPTGAATNIDVLLRYDPDLSIGYRIRVTIGLGGGVTLSVARLTGGTGAVQLDGVTVGTLSGGAYYRIRASIGGATVKAKTWLYGSTGEPDWQVAATDSSPVVTRGQVGFRIVANTGTAGMTYSFRNWQFRGAIGDQDAVFAVKSNRNPNLVDQGYTGTSAVRHLPAAGTGVVTGLGIRGTAPTGSNITFSRSRFAVQAAEVWPANCQPRMTHTLYNFHTTDATVGPNPYGSVIGLDEEWLVTQGTTPIVNIGGQLGTTGNDFPYDPVLFGDPAFIDIIAGHYDYLIDGWCQGLKKMGGEAWVRLWREPVPGHPFYTATPSHYIAAWRYVRDYIRDRVPNAKFMYCVGTGGWWNPDGSAGASQTTAIAFDPGIGWVDAYAADGYERVSPAWQDNADFLTHFNTGPPNRQPGTVGWYEWASGRGVPVIIAETGAQPDPDGILDVQWVNSIVPGLKQMPEIRALVTWSGVNYPLTTSDGASSAVEAAWQAVFADPYMRPGITDRVGPSRTTGRAITDQGLNQSDSIGVRHPVVRPITDQGLSITDAVVLRQFRLTQGGTAVRLVRTTGQVITTVQTYRLTRAPVVRSGVNRAIPIPSLTHATPTGQGVTLAEPTTSGRTDASPLVGEAKALD